MDKPKINFRAWEPLEKRKKKENKNNDEKNNSFYQSNSKVSNQSLNYFEQLIRNKDFTEYEKSTDYHYEEPRANTQYDIEIDHRLESNHRKKYKRRPRGLQISGQVLKSVGAGLGAIATGIIFGHIILNYFVEPVFTQDSISTNPSSNSQVNTINNGIYTNQGQIIPEQIVYMIQAGVFSEYTGAQTILSEQNNMGRAAVVNGNGPYHVFVGIAADKQTADYLKKFLALQGLDLYVKEYTISEYKGNISGDTFKAFAKWISTGEEMVVTLSEQSIRGLLNPQVEIDYTRLQKLHQQFLIEVQALKAELTKDQLNEEQKAVKEMEEQMYYAITALNAYKKNPNPQYLWNIQELLMNYTMSYEELINK